MKKYILPLIVLFFILIAIGVTLFLVSQRQETRSKAAPATVLSLDPKTTSIKVGDEITLNIDMDTHENTLINSVELSLNYDQTVFQALSLQPGGVFTKPLSGPTVGNGVASIAFGTATTSVNKGLTGKATIATLKLKALKAAATSKIDFGNETYAESYDDFQATNSVSSKESATITVTDDNAITTTVSPSVTLTISPSPSVTITVSPSITITTTPTPSATSVPAANNPTSTPSPTPISVLPTQSGSSSQTTTPTVAVSSLANGQTISDTQPTISGKASPNSSLIITIRSDPQTITTTADANGNWTIKPPQPLENGTHTLLVSATDANGNTTTKTVTFTVGLPETATPMPTIIMLIGGFFLLLFGLAKAL